MGAWGHRTFENDSALDWLGDLEDSDASALAEALDTIADAPPKTYLDADDCSAALAAAELIAAALGRGDDRLTKEALAWLDEHRDAVRDLGATRAHLAVEKLYKQSELRELWDENGADTPWHADVRELMKRLLPTAPTSKP
jgi:Domain of unknown function (DUF4259)